MFVWILYGLTIKPNIIRPAVDAFPGMALSTAEHCLTAKDYFVKEFTKEGRQVYLECRKAPVVSLKPKGKQ